MTVKLAGRSTKRLGSDLATAVAHLNSELITMSDGHSSRSYEAGLGFSPEVACWRVSCGLVSDP